MRRFLQRVTGFDTAVYWPPVGQDNYGQYTYGPPIQIKCRWTNLEIRDDSTETIKVFTLYAVQPHGILLHGKLSNVIDASNPLNNPGYVEIKSLKSTPNIKNTVRLIEVKG